MMESNRFEMDKTTGLQSPSLIVGWQTHDVGKIGSKVIQFLNEKLGGKEIGEIKPSPFFEFKGAAFKDDLIETVESKFWACGENDLLLFRSNEPECEWYEFLNTVLDVAQYQGKIKDLYTISGTVSLISHTSPRRILGVFSEPEFREQLRGYELKDMTWEGPPAISSYLLWVAKRRNIPGVSLWPEVPFYLAAGEDAWAIKVALSFLDRRFELKLDLREVDEKITRQGEKIAKLRSESPETNKSIAMLESGLLISQEEQIKLAKEVYEALK
jgi:proteasome assembly chaperone (PAC2) family protein